MKREEALDVALGQIERQFGKGSVMRMSDRPQVSIGAISTGSLALDMALGIGGLPRGRVVEIFGPEASGKTTLVYHLIAEAQRRGGICAFIDAEHAMDPSYARRIGVDIDNLLVSQPDTGEQALEICELLIRSGALDIVAVDSVAALVPKAEIEGEMGDSHVGLQARLMSQALRKLAGTLNRTDTICIFTNQLREKIGVMFGNPETTPGGRALKFYSSVRLDIRRIETLKDGAEAFGNRVRVKVVKNKVAPPFKQAEFDIIYGSGIPWEGTVLDVALEKKVVQKAGSYFSFGDERLGQGRQNATSFLTENPDLVQQILAQIQAEAADDQIISARLLPARRLRRPSRRSRSKRRSPSRAEPTSGGTSDAVESALRSLRHRDRSAAQIDDQLAARGVSEDERSRSARDACADGTRRRPPLRGDARRTARRSRGGRRVHPSRPAARGCRRRARRGCDVGARERARACRAHRGPPRRGREDGALPGGKGLLRRGRPRRRCARRGRRVRMIELSSDVFPARTRFLNP